MGNFYRISEAARAYTQNKATHGGGKRLEKKKKKRITGSPLRLQREGVRRTGYVTDRGSLASCTNWGV